MKSLIQAVAIAAILAAPAVSFAQASNQAAPQGAQAAQAQSPGDQNAAQAGSSGYGLDGRGTWQAGRGNDTIVSSYSPPIHNAR